MKRSSVFAGGVALAGAGLLSAAAMSGGGASLAVIAAGAAASAIVERAGLRLAPNSRASASFLPVLATAALAGAVGGGAAGLAAGLAASLFRGRPFSRMAFNAGSLASSGVAAGAVLSLAGDGFAGLALLGLLATLVNFALSSGLLAGVVTVDAGIAAGGTVLSSLARLTPNYAALGMTSVLLAHQARGEGPLVLAGLGVLLLGATVVVRDAVERVARRTEAFGAGESLLKAA